MSVRSAHRAGRRGLLATVLFALAGIMGLVLGLLPQQADASSPTADRAAAGSPASSAAVQARASGAAAGVTASDVFRNPLNSGPDPFMTHFNGNYYLTTTQGNAIRMWRSPSLATLFTASPITVWTDSDTSRNQQIWAPEFYRFNGLWYMYYTASDGVGDNHRIYVAESAGDDPVGPYHFKAKLAPPNHANDFAIDPSILTVNGKLYLAYSGINQYQHNGLNIAPLSNPYTVSGNAVAINGAGGCSTIREAPEFLYHGGRVWMIYSTCDTGLADYQLWMMSMGNTANPLVPGNWLQHQGAVFSRNNAQGVYGPGHNAFFKSPDGTEDWIVYHAKNTSAYTYSGRTTRAMKFTWSSGGPPAFPAPVSLGTSLALPSGDPGAGTYWINDNGQSMAGSVGTVTYAGGPWASNTGCGVQCFFTDGHWANTAGSTATFTFTGTRISLLSVSDPGYGYADISIDGGAATRVDFYADVRRGGDVQYLSPRLASGQHTLTLRVVGAHNASATASYINVDRAEVWTD